MVTGQVSHAKVAEASPSREHSTNIPTLVGNILTIASSLSLFLCGGLRRHERGRYCSLTYQHPSKHFSVPLELNEIHRIHERSPVWPMTCDLSGHACAHALS
ncbi:unnamed protein product [Scytosiphon promiscuus]